MITSGNFNCVLFKFKCWLCTTFFFRGVLDIVYDFTVCKLNYTIGILLRVFAVMRDDNYKLCLRKAFERIEHLPAGVGVKSARRFIGHNNFRVFYKRTGDSNALELAD